LDLRLFRKGLRSWPIFFVFEPLLRWMNGDHRFEYPIEIHPFDYFSHAWFRGWMYQGCLFYSGPLDGLGLSLEKVSDRSFFPPDSLHLCAASSPAPLDDISFSSLSSSSLPYSCKQPCTTGKHHSFIGYFKFVGTNKCIQIIFVGLGQALTNIWIVRFDFDQTHIFIGVATSPMNILGLYSSFAQGWRYGPAYIHRLTDKYRWNLKTVCFLFLPSPCHSLHSTAWTKLSCRRLAAAGQG
jgi:hypothetical protein